MTGYYVIRFKDGTFIHINPYSSTIPHGFSTEISQSQVLAIRYKDTNGNNIYKCFQGNKTDESGRVWNFSLSGATYTITITPQSGSMTQVSQNLNSKSNSNCQVALLYCDGNPDIDETFRLGIKNIYEHSTYISNDRVFAAYIDGNKFSTDNYSSIGETFDDATIYVAQEVPSSMYWKCACNLKTDGTFFLWEYVRNERRAEFVSNDIFDSNWYDAGSTVSYFSIRFTQDDIEIFVPPTDPYSDGGESNEGGGTGDFDLTSDPIDFPDLPTLSAVDTGFISLFNPSLSELQALANYMWDGSLFDLSTWQKLFADPMDAILGLSIVPVAVPDAGQSNIKVGNIATPISMNKASTQYVTVDCGTLNVNEYWGAYLDYEPYSKAEIYLPYCGIHPIAIDDIMGKAVHVKYNVDILSGACCAMVKCGDSVLYSFIGQCASSIPISGTDFTQMINGIISAAVSVGSMVASGGATAPLAVPSLANTAINSMKPSIEKSGAMGGTGGMLAIQKPYLILTRPKQALPSNQNKYTGYPSYITCNLGDLSGYTEIEKIHLEGFTGTDFELQETLKLLETGVIF